MFSNKPINPKDIAKQATREVRNSERDLDKEIRNLERAETQALKEAEKQTRLSNQAAARAAAREVVRIRSQKEKLIATKTQIRTTTLRATTNLKTTAAITNAIASTTKAMKAINQVTSPQALQQQMMEFEKQSAQLDFADDLLEDLMEDEDSDVEAESDALYSQVLEELNLDLSSKMKPAPRKELQPVSTNDLEDKNLEEMFKRLVSS
eukprot:TRINITY_DN858_c0_g1_i1.p1 TRINITY_DN858_c0_g1~~TRINITY_DN858_c0_g1_i1.p1  ORF type:complete len:208 (-),score=115.72 TRINITY_DN858_c0_g1_i1:54-677(-)